MDRVDHLASLLMVEKGFRRMEPDPAAPARGNQAVIERETLLAEPPPFGFVGTRAHWGRALIALVVADDLDLAGMERFAERFFALVFGEFALFGPSHGILCYVFERPPAPPIIKYIRSLKRFTQRNTVYMAAWTIDLSTGHVIPHRWLPWGLYPGRAYLEEAIRRSRHASSAG